MRRIVIVGGYGEVGREAAAALLRWYPGAVVAAGRAPERARPVPGASMQRVDLADPSAVDQMLAGTDAVLMCVEADNPGLARACLARGVHYVDVSASRQQLAGVVELDGLAREHGAVAALSVGLAPGVSNLLARYCAQRSAERRVDIGVLIGAGERHGAAAVEWTVDGLTELGTTWRMEFPAPYATRTLYQFPFSDQYTLPETLGLDRVRTGFCLDSAALTAVLGAARRPVAIRLLRRRRVRAALIAALSRVHVGADGFAVTVRSGDVTAAFHGRRQSRATGLAAALLIRRLPTLPAGVRHIEQLVDPAEFLTELAGHGFTLDLPAGQAERTGSYQAT